MGTVAQFRPPDEPSREREQLDLIAEKLESYGAPSRNGEGQCLNVYGRFMSLAGWQRDLIDVMWSQLLADTRRIAMLEGHPIGVDVDPSGEVIEQLRLNNDLRFVLHRALPR